MLRSLAAALTLGLAAPAPFQLSFLPAPTPSGFNNASLHSWGGSVIAAEGAFHLFASAFVGNCGLNAWGSNSIAIRAVGPTPLGPFAYAERALPYYHHNVAPIQAPDGTFLIFAIGMVPDPAPVQCHAGRQQQQQPHPLTHGFESVEAWAAPTVRGPWAAVPGSVNGRNLFNGTNPAPAFDPSGNGTLYVMSHDARGFVVSVAASWRGPYAPPVLVFPGRLGDYAFEDPFLYFAPAVGRWRALFHAYNASDTAHQYNVGGFAETEGADVLGPWSVQDPATAPAYTTEFTSFVAGSSGATQTTVFGRRERPKLLFSADGEPTALVTGVCPKDSTACFTAVAPLAAPALLPPPLPQPLAPQQQPLPPVLQGVQGLDDDGVTHAALGMPDGGVALRARYATQRAVLSPGLRRYNFFWATLEGAVPASSSPIACPPTHVLVPANETERVRLGYNLFHCYDVATLAAFDEILALDASIGAASAFIMYATPDWAQHPGCTGFPWPPNPNFKLGCLPWDHLDSYYDFVLVVLLRWRAPWGSGLARVSALCVWNEVQSLGWSDPSPVLPNRGPNALSPAQLQVYATMIANLTLLAGAAARVASPAAPPFLFLSTDHFLTAPAVAPGETGHLGLLPLLDAMWPILWAGGGGSLGWGIAVHPYDAGDPRQDLTKQGIYTFATLARTVGAYQCSQLVARGVPEASCAQRGETKLWASEQGCACFFSRALPTRIA